MRRLALAVKLLLVVSVVACAETGNDAADPGSAQPDPSAPAAGPAVEQGGEPTATRVESVASSPESPAGVEPPGHPADAPPRPAPERASGDTVGVLDFLPQLEMAPTAREWSTWHPEWARTLHVYDFDPVDERPDAFGERPTWCLRAFAVEAVGAADTTMARLNERAPSRLTLVRAAESLGTPITLRRFYFYGGVLPDVPDDYALPEFTEGMEYHLEHCRLGLVSVEVIGGPDAAATVDALRTDYDGALGERTPAERAPYGLGDEGAVTWADGALTVGVGAHFSGDPVTYAFHERMGTGFALSRNDYGPSRVWEAEVLAQAVEDSGLTGEAAEIYALFEAGEEPEEFQARREMVLTFLTFMTRRPPDLTPGTPLADTVGARLVTADLFLHTHYPYLPYPPSDAEVENFRTWMQESAQPFEDLGAPYRYSELDYEWGYRRALAGSAEAVGPGGWGDLIQILPLEEGCNWDPTIQRGGELLERIERPRFRARLNLLMGDAYASIVHFHQRDRLREGVVDDIEEVRRRAIEHYVAAIEGDLDETQKVWAWRYAYAMTHNLRMPARYECERA